MSTPAMRRHAKSNHHGSSVLPRQCGSKRKKILRYLKEVSGKPLQQKDVENMIAEMRRETYISSDDNVRVSELLQNFGEGPGNTVRIFRDPATSLTSCITFQTAHMRRMARKFPEALCIDATHETNLNREDFLSKLKDVFESRFGPIMATVMEVKTSQASYKTTVIAAEYWLFSGLNSTCLSPELLHPTRAFLFLAATNCTPTS
ncbi:hypothetical protein F443_22615 [Phytophthora nicotianae P1569]|uniref:ZSWIM1/3 RNaseH-like domain-containing protein n=1 Tax=Phytophthora nicotianae P1569 TaxID=1317065 RepID=V9DTS4_PHYNI|nr:hypothetical protein F443_22615 [Phytophthora nicotianae P1569]